jgi:Siphovirus Gp157
MPNDLYRATLEHRALVQRLREQFSSTDDAELADTIEGETTLDAAILSALRAANENDATLRGLEWHMERLTERAALLKARSEKLRAAALQAAQEAGIKMPLKAPDFTATVALGKPKVILTGDVPDTFMRVKKEPNKTAIADALAAGVKLPWAELANANPHWSIRTK